MKITTAIKSNFIYSVALLYVILFTYAAVSKILDFQNFQAQLGQSPLISAFAHNVSFGVIIVELGIAVLLVISNYRIKALYLAVALMTIFTVYIIIILNFSSFIPCSCGGILESLGWTEHLIFNCTFIILGIIAILLYKNNWKAFVSISTVAILSTTTVVVLFLWSEDVMQKQNPFTRRFTPNTAERTATRDLKNYGFYFAGQHKGKVYLGNTHAPLTIIELDSTLKQRKQYTIHLDNDNFPFKAVKIKILAPYFFLYDGYVPIIYRGLLSDWKAEVWITGKPYFTGLQPVSANECIFRSQELATGENVLGTIEVKKILNISKAKNILQKQIDGIFDTDGTLAYSEGLNTFIYTYLYRNQFIVTNSKLQLKYRGKTIDTTSMANLKVVKIKLSGDTKLAAPPRTVNLRSIAFQNLLFIQSGLRGRFENEKIWRMASIIDVYNHTNNRYLSSFYIYHEDKAKMTDFIATEKNIYAIIGHQIVRYKFGYPIRSQFSHLK